VFCTQCGQQNPDDSRFCARCGAPTARPGSAPEGADVTSTLSMASLQGQLDQADGDPSQEDATPDADQGTGLEGLPSGSALLVVRRGPNAGSRFLLDQDVTTAGRHPDSEIFLDDVTVSRRHAEFVREGADFLVRDVGSLNGTYLNRQRIESATLAGGDEVQIGKYRLVFLVGTGARTAEDGR
jgi:pSer/pThr/pTyr-binding forkhead associated (FHA) protein